MSIHMSVISYPGLGIEWKVWIELKSRLHITASGWGPHNMLADVTGFMLEEKQSSFEAITKKKAFYTGHIICPFFNI